MDICYEHKLYTQYVYTYAATAAAATCQAAGSSTSQAAIHILQIQFMFIIYLHLPFQIEEDSDPPLHGGWTITLLSGKGMMASPFHFEEEGGHLSYFDVYILCVYISEGNPYVFLREI